MDTPCKSVCRLDTGRGICLGCGRTLAEIAGWRDMTDAQRRAIMDRLDERLLGHASFDEPAALKA